MVCCVPIAGDGTIEPSWGRASRVAVAEVEAGTVMSWQEFEVGWGDLHDTETEGAHHARVARFLIDHGVQVVLARHMGDDMRHMLDRMGVDVRLGASGEARPAVLATGSVSA